MKKLWLLLKYWFYSLINKEDSWVEYYEKKFPSLKKDPLLEKFNEKKSCLFEVGEKIIYNDPLKKDPLLQKFNEIARVGSRRAAMIGENDDAAYEQMKDRNENNKS